ncbi:helix-turn-helix domain-containing protein [uncultured Dokdonia sp.]|uniref:helix-turn-helix domain-containing protein n=1 Tax=uncultured Dokdonia sp. TaxID=575653 RepID=UPI0026198279|nr:helix-turn-helix domain-containing protein [uncultured Dokdonia sp.]
MFFGFGPKSSILLIFFFHGIVFSFLLLKKGIQSDIKSSKWLSLFVFLCTLYITPFMLGYANWYSEPPYRQILFFIPFQQLFLMGPVLYFYSQILLNASFKISKKDYIHFVPAFVYMIYNLIVFITDVFIVDEPYFYADGRDKDFDLWYQIVGLASMVFYLVLSLRFYINYKKIAFETVSFADSILFKWLQHFFIAFLVILLLRVLYFILNPEWGQFGRKFWYYLCFSALYYYIALSGYSNTVKAMIPIDTPVDEADPDIPIRHTEKKRLEITIPNTDAWKQKLLDLMLEKKLYENPSLTVSDVASQLETNTKFISSIVNSGFNMNFNDFINYYRVEAVKEQLKNNAQKTKTLLGIALECGFNSKATFNRAFKKHTSLSPKEFLATLR